MTETVAITLDSMAIEDGWPAFRYVEKYLRPLRIHSDELEHSHSYEVGKTICAVFIVRRRRIYAAT